MLLQMAFFHSFSSRVVLEVKNLPANSGNIRDSSLIPGSGRSPGEGNDNSLQYSCLEGSMDRGAWQAKIHGGRKESNTTERLSLTHPSFLWGRGEGRSPNCSK